MNSLPPLWQKLAASVRPDDVLARKRLQQLPLLAEKRCSFRKETLKGTLSYAEKIRQDPELFQRWSLLRAIVLQTHWDDALEAPFPTWFCKDVPEEPFLLTVALSCIPDAEKIFHQKDLPLEKLYASLDEFQAWAGNCERNYALTGLDFSTGFAWIVLRLFTGDVLRFGRLEYNRGRSFSDILVFRHKHSGQVCTLLNGAYQVNADGQVAAPGETVVFQTRPSWGIFGEYTGYPVSSDGRILPETVQIDSAQWECLLRPWDEVLFMHIPELGPLVPEKIQESYAAVREYYFRKESDYHPKAILCSSWLFDPVIQRIMPENSNLCRFQKSGFLLPSQGRPSDAPARVFGVRGEKEGVLAVEWKTSLQKALGRYIADGGFCRGGRFFHLLN